MRDRTNDDDALRNKVDEAMTVYDEYVKNQTGGDEGGVAHVNGNENLNPTVDDVKDADA